MTALVLIPSLASLAACGGHAGPQVARMPSSATSPATSSASSSAPPAAGLPGSSGDAGAGGLPPDPDDSDTAAGRPQFRLDDTEARRTALVNAYNQCLLDHGATRGGRTGAAQPVAGGAGGTPYLQVADPVPAAAKEACASRLPLMPPQLEAATNPNFHEQSLAYVGCLKQHGEWVELLNDHDLDWTYVAGHPVPDDGGAIEQQCLMAAFS